MWGDAATDYVRNVDSNLLIVTVTSSSDTFEDLLPIVEIINELPLIQGGLPGQEGLHPSSPTYLARPAAARVMAGTNGETFATSSSNFWNAFPSFLPPARHGL